MLVLVIDTAASTGGVLLARSEGATGNAVESPGATRVLGTRVLEPRAFSTQLIPAIAGLLEDDRRTLSSVDAFAAIVGPGSFTGLRVGLSAVKGMAEATGKPVIAVSRLAVMASAAAAGGLVHAVLDAGRGALYHGAYRDAGAVCVAESLETLESLAVVLERAPGTVVAWEADVLTRLRALPGTEPRGIPSVGVAEALPLVLAAWRARRFTDVARLDANYLHRINPGIAAPVIAAAGVAPKKKVSKTPQT